MMKNFLQKLCLPALLLLSAHAYCQVPKLSSYPVAAPTIFLDFDGQTVQTPAWQSGNAFICAPSTMNAAQITDIFNRVSEDYRPFAVNITTDSTVYFAAPPAQRVRMIITSTSAWMPGVGGTTYIGSFTWGSETPGFIFEDRISYNPKNIAECCTHESGHAVGLSHQARYDSSCNLLEQYNSGTGTGQTSWAPVMGNSYAKNMTGWSDGPTPYGCTLIEDNLTTITTQNGFGYRADDYAETMNASTTNLNPVSFSMPGLISTPTDKDAFKLVLTQSGPYHMEANPYSVGANNDGADLDIMLSIYNSAGTLIQAYNPIDAMNVTVDTTLNAGTYYITISGAGNNNTSNYGSLGSYTFIGNKGGPLAIHGVTLAGITDKNLHRLSWNVIADEPLASQVLETSDNGIDFHPLVITNGTATSYSYAPAKSGTYFYRLKAISVLNQDMYSNIVTLKASGSGKLFTVSTLVQQTISVTATDSYNYNLYDANARLLASGKMQKGTGTINVQNLPKGMYILQMMNDNYKQTERIIKE
jgi:hypothetical protein